MVPKLFNFLKSNWGVVGLSAILLFIIVRNIHPGYVVLGNDNFSPELDPKLTFDRQIFSPAWRTHRVLGLPSDSEQADIFRSGIYMVLETVLPVWVVSQGYLFFTFFIASFSMGFVVQYFTKRFYPEQKQMAFFFGGLLYLCTMLTSWIYFFPVHLFVAAYAFLPLVLWRMLAFLEKPSIKNSIFLLIATLLLLPAALTATMFLVGGAVVAVLSGIWFLSYHRSRKSLLVLATAYFIVFGIHLFWALPFLTYVKSNTTALKASAINRDITATTIENEARNNTAFNTIRYYASWMDTKEDNTHFTFTYRDWYKNSIPGTLLSFVPLLLGIIGVVGLIRGRVKKLFFIPIIAFLGWYFIKGINPPFGFVYTFIQDHFQTVAQVFRWQSSKMWPMLALTMPTLGVVGVLWSNSIAQKRFGKNLAVIRLGIIALFLLVFVYPYFTGNLVRDKVFVKVPTEYSELATYLKKTDPASRIYIAPEANTLYFRNYSWGFWGSVFLNYVLPNPIVEKALVIGSFENEQAFRVLTNSYFSSDPNSFTRALLRYQTPYVLSDKYASSGEVGYPYDWELHAKVVEDNPQLEKVWQKGKLTLYKIKNYSATNTTAQPVYSGTDFIRLNTIKNILGDTTSYYTKDGSVGSIYPLALQFDSFEYSQQGIVGKTTYKGPQAQFAMQLSAQDATASPTVFDYSLSTKELVAKPLIPTITIGKVTYGYQLPEKTFTVKNASAFLSVDDQVIDMRSTSANKTSGMLYGSVGNATIRGWDGSFAPFDLVGGKGGVILFCNNSTKVAGIKMSKSQTVKCGTPELPVLKDMLLEADIRIAAKTTKPVQVLLCFDSAVRRSCTNRNVNMFVGGSSGEVGEASMLIPWVYAKGDTLKVYVDIKTQGADATVSIDKLLLRIHDQSDLVVLKGETKGADTQTIPVIARPGDNIAVTIPVLEGPNSAPMRSDGIVIPEASTTAFEDGKPFMSRIGISPQKGLEITNMESNSSVYPKLSYIDPRGGMGMVFVQADNTSGIPIDLSLRGINAPHRVWQQKIPYRTDAKSLDVFLMPQEIQSYYLEAFSTGLGPRPSTTIIEALYFQVIPKSWYGLRMQPVKSLELRVQSLPQPKKDTNTYSGNLKSQNSNPKTILTIPTAISANWIMHIGGKEQKDRVVVDGWQQGWIVGNGGKIEVSFAPSSLVYIGFAPLVLIVGWIILQTIRKILNSKH